MYCVPPSMLDFSGKYRNPVGHTINAQLMSKDWPNNLIDTAEVYEFKNATLTLTIVIKPIGWKIISKTVIIVFRGH